MVIENRMEGISSHSEATVVRSDGFGCGLGVAGFPRHPHHLAGLRSPGRVWESGRPSRSARNLRCRCGASLHRRAGLRDNLLSQLADDFASNAKFSMPRRTDRREFMALLGVFVSITLGVSVLWLAIPPLVIELCVRAK